MNPGDIHAFPRPASGTMEFAQEGMTLRDYFAAKAMQGFVADLCDQHDMTQAQISRWAYAMADAMLKAREAK
jgi:hypothetical protein